MKASEAFKALLIGIYGVAGLIWAVRLIGYINGTFKPDEFTVGLAFALSILCFMTLSLQIISKKEQTK